ncbi:hypothetical protein BWQ96_08572 [Gracilariopsis chorda]|uniref:Uncharacterized protein n=1 Tax=Gracilariopsis chorda TaxID=448386 RepID=A0A2V3IKQ3_9FLOR|nr:hypothetical protein BWQ96_08572 [Gracilariopsis chorda]|eukprot:PXF41710.1 hypothetical protein BWQ96_08572 [Gracilariopsis chorda]
MLSFDDIEDTCEGLPTYMDTNTTTRRTSHRNDGQIGEVYHPEHAKVSLVIIPDLCHTEEGLAKPKAKNNGRRQQLIPQKLGSRQENRTTREVLGSIYVKTSSLIESEHVITTPINHSDAFAKETMDTASTSDEYQELLYSGEEYEKRYTPEASSEETIGIWSRNKRVQVFQINENNRSSDPFHEQMFCHRPGMNDFSPSDAFLKFSVDTEASVLTASRETGDLRD